MPENDTSCKNTFGSHTISFVQKANIPERDLIPLIPFGADLSSQTTIKKSDLGKIPGKYNFKTKKWSGLYGTWASEGLSPREIAQCRNYPTANVGLRAAEFPCIDVDTNSQEACDLVVALAEEKLGFAPMRVREGAPRALLVYARAGEEPIRKMRFAFKCGEGKSHLVECLGLGQQYAICGTHKSGGEYEWAAEADLMSWGADKLTKVTVEQVLHFFEVLKADVTARGWQVVTDVKRLGALKAGEALEDMEPIVSTELALSALRAIPNTQEVFTSREELVAILAAFKAAVGKEALKKDVFEAVKAWASEGWPDPDWIDGPWRSLDRIRIGPSRLFGLAHAYGWAEDAKEEFKDPADETAIDLAKKKVEEKLKALADKVYYWPEVNRWIERETKKQLMPVSFNCSPHLGVTIAKAGENGKKTAASILLNSDYVKTVDSITYSPGDREVFTQCINGEARLFFNTWKTANHPEMAVDDKDIAPWLKHVEYLFEDEKDRNYLLDFFAHLVQKRGHKIRWAPVVVGAQGVGKDLMLRPILKGLGEHRNTKIIQPERIMQSFNDFWETELAVVEEISRTEKTDIYEKIKAIISGTGSDLVTIERKYEKPYEIRLCVNMIFFTNHTDALNLSLDDRRFFIIHSYSTPKDAKYYDALAKFYENDGWLKVFNWLKRRDISKFNPDARPLFNDAKLQMIEESAPFYCLWMRDTYLVSKGVVKVQDILNDFATDFNFPQRIRDQVKSQAQVVRALRFSGWVNIQIRNGKENHRFWVKSDEIAKETSAAIVARYEAEQEKKLAYVGKSNISKTN